MEYIVPLWGSLQNMQLQWVSIFVMKLVLVVLVVVQKMD